MKYVVEMGSGVVIQSYIPNFRKIFFRHSKVT
jgi:hypothetical protein